MVILRVFFSSRVCLSAFSFSSPIVTVWLSAIRASGILAFDGDFCKGKGSKGDGSGRAWKSNAGMALATKTSAGRFHCQ